VLALDGATADVERRGDPAINAEQFSADGRGHNVHDGVDCADFMEVNLLDIDAVNGGFSFTEHLKGAAGAVFHRIRKIGAADDVEDRRKMAMLVGVFVLVGMRIVAVIVMRMVRRGGVFVRMRVAMLVMMLMCVAVRGRGLLGRIGEAIADQHIHLGAGKASAKDFALFKARANVERRYGAFELGEGYACINERAQQHVATDARKTFQVSNSHID
jgi:hypothetical protein